MSRDFSGKAHETAARDKLALVRIEIDGRYTDHVMEDSVAGVMPDQLLSKLEAFVQEWINADKPKE